MKALGGIRTDSIPSESEGSAPMIRPMSCVSGHHETLTESASIPRSCSITSRFAIRLR